MSDLLSGSRSLSLNKTAIKSNFWLSRMHASKAGALPAMWARMKETGRWDVLRLEWKEGMPNKPHRFWDSDVAKWTEAACYALTPPLSSKALSTTQGAEHSDVDEFLASKVSEAVSLVAEAQWKDGYINSYFTVVEPGKRWSNIAWSHEQYCAGHLLEAAIAHHNYAVSTHTKCSADPNALLNPLLKYVAHIDERFGPDVSNGQKRGYPGHQEIELALLRLYEYLGTVSFSSQDIFLSAGQIQDIEHTRNRALSLASFFVHERGRLHDGVHYYDLEAHFRKNDPPAQPGPSYPTAPRWTYNQANAPISEILNIDGHSVRAGYWLTAAAHLARLTRDKNILIDVRRLWKSMTERKMHLTGGLGAIGEWEGFGPDYYFPNESAYLETCASVALIFFAHQMLLIDPMNVQYGDTLERALYNGALVGMSLDGKTFFYDNPLATVGMWRERTSWFEVSCCPPNLARLLLSLGKYIYTQSASEDHDTLHVHLLIESEATLTTQKGKEVRIMQESTTPWGGHVVICIEGAGAQNLDVVVRIPDWTDPDDLKLVASGYTISRPQSRLLCFSPVFADAEVYQISIDLPVRPRLIHPHPLDTENHASIAVARGPFIYCVETVDNHTVGDLRRLRIPDDIQFEDVPMTMPSGPPVIGLKATARAIILPDENVSSRAEEMHDGWVVLDRDVSTSEPFESRDLDVTFIPFFAWANRGRSDVRIWLPRCSVGR